VKCFNCNTPDEDNRKACKEEAPQAPQSIAARRLDRARQNNIVHDKTKQRDMQQQLSSSKPIAPSPATAMGFNSTHCHGKLACCEKENATMKFQQ